jgi:hypothetical protein
VNANASRLEGVTKELRIQWLQTREQWRDDRAREFEKKYLDDLFAAVDKSVAVIDQLDKLLGKIRKDCE